MAVKTNHQQVIRQLKKQVKLLQQREQHNKKKINDAFKKMRMLGRSFKDKLEGKVRVIKTKIADVQASTYSKVALDIERKLLRGIEAKSKALASALDRIEKKHTRQIKRKPAKKRRKSAKRIQRKQ